MVILNEQLNKCNSSAQDPPTKQALRINLQNSKTYLHFNSFYASHPTLKIPV